MNLCLHKSGFHKRGFDKCARQERGYVLLTLMLFVALLTLGLLAMVQNIESQIKRDREEELIHRGVQYSRAVRLFFVKFKRFPGSIEELENTNNIRFLRKRYKDPITGKDFKPLHLNEVEAFQRSAAAVQPARPQSPAAGSNNGQLGPDDIEPTPIAQSSQTLGVATGDSGDREDSSSAANAPQATSDPNSHDSEPSAPALHGVPIVGVASLSKDKTIREFNKKDHYNQWQFIFNPSNGSAGLINAPDQPLLLRSVQPNPSASQGQSNADPAAGASVPNPR